MPVRTGRCVKAHFVFFKRYHLRGSAGTEESKRVVNGRSRERFDFLIKRLINFFRSRMRRVFGNKLQNGTALAGRANAVFDEDGIWIVIGHGLRLKMFTGLL